jgi:Holliday junction resolvasome RuvABC endonuclease subunit
MPMAQGLPHSRLTNAAPVVPSPPFPVGGVDYGGRRVAFCVLSPNAGLRIWHRAYAKYETFDPRMYEAMWTEIRDTSEQLGVQHWCVESPIAGGNGNVQTALKMAMTAGALLAGIGYEATVDLVPPSTWKKEVIGHGNASKPDVAAWLEKRWPFLHAQAAKAGGRSGPTQDCVDATCLAICASLRCTVAAAG